MPAGTWVDISPNEQLQDGKHYRTIGTVRGSYNAATREALKRGLQVKLEAAGNHFVDFTSSPPLYNAHDNTEGPWVFIARFDRPIGPQPSTAGFDGKSILLILAAIAGVALALSILSSKVQRLVEAVADAVDKVVNHTLSPGTVVLAALGIFLITRTHRSAST